MIKKIILTVGIVLFFKLLFDFIIPRPITPAGYFDDTFKKRIEQYNNVSLYTAKCDIYAIQWVAVFYNEDKLNNIKCKEWIKKRDKCISLHLEYKDKIFKDESKLCRNRSKK